MTLDPTDAEGLEGLVRSGVLSARVSEALDRVKSLEAQGQTPALLVAKSRLLAAHGEYDEALYAAREAAAIEPRPKRLANGPAALNWVIFSG